MNEVLKMILDAIMPNILEIVITVISIIVARYVIPFIKEDVIPWLKEKKLYSTIKKFVQAVEKMAEAGIIEKKLKKEKVIELLKKKGIEINDVVDSFIESCVKELDIVTSTIYDEILVEPNDIEADVDEPEIIIETENV